MLTWGPWQYKKNIHHLLTKGKSLFMFHYKLCCEPELSHQAKAVLSLLQNHLKARQTFWITSLIICFIAEREVRVSKKENKKLHTLWPLVLPTDSFSSIQHWQQISPNGETLYLKNQHGSCDYGHHFYFFDPPIQMPLSRTNLIFFSLASSQCVGIKSTDFNLCYLQCIWKSAG